MNIKYRPDIDGLRAIAVLSVVLFHAGVPLVNGGFIGVDVFFVISGFLITSIIHKEATRRTFSLVNFYDKRIRRIFPAFFVVVVFSIVLSSIIFLPRDFESFSKSLIASVLSVSNFLFWKEAGYFDGSADFKPLLHTWSLSVEEQFYIFFPLTLILLFKFFKQHLASVILLIALLSFILSVWGVVHQPIAAFFLSPTRAWELAIGALLAIGVLPTFGLRWVRELLSFIGIGLIFFGVFFISSETPFPGVSALLPCVGTGLVIYAGLSGKTMVGNVLSWRPLVFIGLISYSLYLWHWPLFVFAKYYLIRPLTNVEILIVLLTSLFMAILSWFFVERPFRKNHEKFNRAWVFSTAATLTLCLIIVGFIGLSFKGLENRFSNDVVQLANGGNDISLTSRACMRLNEKGFDKEKLCYIGDNKKEATFVILGDSHAGALMPGFDLAAKKAHVKGIHGSISSCAPLDGVAIKNSSGRDYKSCASFRDDILTFIEENKLISSVVLSARWPVYSEGSRYGIDDTGPNIILVDEEERELGNHNVFSVGLERTVARLRQAKKQVYIVFSTPEVGWNVPSVLARSKAYGVEEPYLPPLVSSFKERNLYVKSVMESISLRYQVNIVYPHKKLCDSNKCLVTIDGYSLYSDDDHLSVFGANFISSEFDSILMKVSNIDNLREKVNKKLSGNI